MTADTANTRKGLAFWAAILWLAVVVFSAVTAKWWAMPAFDAIDWNNPCASPGTRVEKAILQNAKLIATGGDLGPSSLASMQTR